MFNFPLLAGEQWTLVVIPLIYFIGEIILAVFLYMSLGNVSFANEKAYASRFCWNCHLWRALQALLFAYGFYVFSEIISRSPSLVRHHSDNVHDRFLFFHPWSDFYWRFVPFCLRLHTQLCVHSILSVGSVFLFERVANWGPSSTNLLFSHYYTG